MTVALALVACGGEPATTVATAPAPPAPGDAKATAQPAEALVPDADPLPAAAQDADTSADEGPSIAAYPPVQIEKLVVRRNGARVELQARLSRVPGATDYELEAAKTLMFEPLVAQHRGHGRNVLLGPIAPGMFFVHARAIGSAGEGPFGDVRVVNAHAIGVAKLITVPVATVTVSAAARNDDATTNTLDRRPLDALKQHYQRLQHELEQVEALRRDLQAKASALRTGPSVTPTKSAAAAELATELGALETMRQQLEREIATELAEIERSLAKN